MDKTEHNEICGCNTCYKVKNAIDMAFKPSDMEEALRKSFIAGWNACIDNMPKRIKNKMEDIDEQNT